MEVEASMNIFDLLFDKNDPIIGSDLDNSFLSGNVRLECVYEVWGIEDFGFLVSG